MNCRPLSRIVFFAAMMLTVDGALARGSMRISTRQWNQWPLAVCGQLAPVEDTRPEAVVRWLDAYFLELASVFPESTQRLLNEIYFQDAYVQMVPGLAQQRRVLVKADLVNTGNEVIPYIEVDRALRRAPVLRRAALLQQLIGVLGPTHSHSEARGVPRAYRERDGSGLTLWTSMLAATVQTRLLDALVALDWEPILEKVGDEAVTDVFWRSTEVHLPVRGRPARRFQQLLAAAEEERPCQISEHVDIPVPKRPLRMPTELPPRSALEAARPRE